jgi:hypothetical protein
MIMGENTMQLFRHRKRGSVYTMVGSAKLQTDTPLSDMAEVIIYRHVETGQLWARPPSEFYDGRFDPLDTDDLGLAPRRIEGGAE